MAWCVQAFWLSAAGVELTTKRCTHATLHECAILMLLCRYHACASFIGSLVAR